MINTKLILNYSEFLKDGYIDNDLLFGNNWELFWNFSSTILNCVVTVPVSKCRVFTAENWSFFILIGAK